MAIDLFIVLLREHSLWDNFWPKLKVWVSSPQWWPTPLTPTFRRWRQANLLSLRPVWSTESVLRQPKKPCLQNQTKQTPLSPPKKNNRKEKKKRTKFGTCYITQWSGTGFVRPRPWAHSLALPRWAQKVFWVEDQLVNWSWSFGRKQDQTKVLKWFIVLKWYLNLVSSCVNT